MALTGGALRQKALAFFREEEFRKTAFRTTTLKPVDKLSAEYIQSLGHTPSINESKKLVRAIEKAWEEYCV